jgi:hypothetical protein
MTIERITEFAPADRYLYDFGACSSGKGWAQVDTKQDASYYGTWTNPERREIFTYCEGDTTLIRCGTDDEFCAELRKVIEWNKEAGYWLGIDPGWPNGEPCKRITAAFTRLGLAEYLH